MADSRSSTPPSVRPPSPTRSSAGATRSPLSPARKPWRESPAARGFYMADSPFMKIAEREGLDFNSDKKVKSQELSMQAKANDVFEEHHVGRRWAEMLALMTLKTGAYRELECVSKTPYGGVDEDGIDPWIPMDIVEEAKEDAKRRQRVAARKYANRPEMFREEQLSMELWKKIGKPDLSKNLPRTREKGAFDGANAYTPVKGRMGGEDADGDGKITNEEMSPTDIMMMIT